MVMNFLGQKDALTASELGKRTGLDSATLTGILDRLETAGLMERKRHPDDRRAILVCLTNKGRETAADLYDMTAEANRSFLSPLTEEETSILKALLSKVRGTS
jgi:DNA-binding MarR family transcriptional regulator